MLSKNLSAQGATNMVVKLLKVKIRTFLEIEQSLRNVRAPQESSKGLISGYAWIRSSVTLLAESVMGPKENGSEAASNPILNSLASLPRNDASSKLVSNLLVYIQILRDYISGNVHWFYETELYFGTKGEEVKAFGWIFLNSPSVRS